MTYTVIVAEDEELLLTNLVQKIQKADPDFWWQELHKQAIRLWLW